MNEEGQETLSSRSGIREERLERLEREVQVWSPACSVFWGLWGIVQAEEQVTKILEGRENEGIDFDYLVSFSMWIPGLRNLGWNRLTLGHSHMR